MTVHLDANEDGHRGSAVRNDEDDDHPIIVYQAVVGGQRVASLPFATSSGCKRAT